MNEEAAFLKAIRGKPDDNVARLVYADWLDEQGGTVNTFKSTFLRLHCQAVEMEDAKEFLTAANELFRLAKYLDSPWLGIVSNMKIENCGVAFEFQCPKRWDKLRPTIREDVRFCDACQKEVYFCETMSEARVHAWQGNCVAVQLGLPRTSGDLDPRGMVVGMLA